MPEANEGSLTGEGRTVSVISGRTNTVVATIPDGQGPFGVAVNPKTNTIYVTNPPSETVTVISGQTNTVVATIPVAGGLPSGVAVNPKTKIIYVANLLSDTVSVINGRTNTVVATVPVGSGPSGAAVTRKPNTAYVTSL